MKTRIITAIVCLLIFLPVLYFASSPVFMILLSLLSALAAHEILSCVGVQKKLYISVPSIIYAALIPAFARLMNLFPKLIPEGISRSFVLLIIVLCYLGYLLFMTVFAFQKIDVREIASVFFLVSFCAFAFYCLIMTQRKANIDYLLIFIAAWSTDTFAIFGGKLFGKHKLCPNLSPKKTVEGAISGIVGAIIGFIVYGVAISLIYDLKMNYLTLALLAIPASAIAQLGDLFASAIKRSYNIKDFGRIFPGHGGVLDRFDSVLALSIATFIFIALSKSILNITV